jgi:multimeric flavodoxin WrbA
MKLMAIIGSPRKGGNTELIIDQIIAGCRSKIEVEAEKLLIVDNRIEYCTGCLTCTFPPPGKGECHIKDDMAGILQRMLQCDAFVFGTPNHMRTITAPLLNFLSRMLPLLVFKAEYDDEGNRVSGSMTSKIQGAKVAEVISQGEPYFCSSLVHEVLANNLNDFRLESAGNIVCMGNLDKGEVAKHKDDLNKAHTLGVQLACMALRA